jgi:hypothetical protein
MIWTQAGASFIAAVWLVSGCTKGDHEGATAAPTRVAPPATDTTAAVTPNVTLEPGALATVAAVPVEGRTGPGGRPVEVASRTAGPQNGHARRFGTITLPIVLRTRTPALVQYPCTACHFGRRVVMTDDRIRDAHQNLKPVHPQLTGARCSTCHLSENVELLALLGGGQATLDQSYQLCAQCHSRQAEAWAGGAHGKRLDGWQGRRVVMACTDCHDPHDPAAQKRIPFRAPQIERTRANP